ncbi:MAG: hypothetical protein CMF51_04530 [Legionellales bacterium]|nr:hypothetical protein [Legionellales bacterium]
MNGSCSMKVLNVILILIILLSSSLISAARYSMDQGDLIGEIHTLSLNQKTSWNQLAIEYGISVKDLKQANLELKHTQWLKKETQVVIPTRYILPPQQYRTGIVINLAEQRLYFFPNHEPSIVYTYPIAIGRDGWHTPIGHTRIVHKKEAPTWRIPESIRVHTLDTKGQMLPEFVPPGPSNPLGTHALYLKFKNILIHGTNNSNSIGNIVSSGCIRMHNADIQELFKKAVIGTSVVILNHGEKMGRHNDQIYLEVHPKGPESDQTLNQYNHYHFDPHSEDFIDISKIKITRETQSGIPTLISFITPEFFKVNQTQSALIEKAAHSAILNLILNLSDILDAPQTACLLEAEILQEKYRPLRCHRSHIPIEFPKCPLE